MEPKSFSNKKFSVRVQRLGTGPIIRPGMDSRMGTNINGPSLIRAPGWIENPLGKYYLYFANHKGRYIRLAYADQLEGPWKIYAPGCLQIEQSHFPAETPEIPAKIMERKADLSKVRIPGVPSYWDDLTSPHIASPDVHVLHENREIRMYFHGLESVPGQISRAATSKDGINFTAHEEVIVPRPYFRMFPYDGQYYGMAMPGVFYRSSSGLTDFEEGPTLFNSNMRHAAFLLMENHLLVFWTQVGQAPERILLSVLDISDDWSAWQESDPMEILRPEFPWEGSDEPLTESVRSNADIPVNQLRDPAIFQDGDRTFLLYATAGESGIALSEIFVE